MQVLILIGTTRRQRTTIRAAKHIESKVQSSDSLEACTIDLKDLEIPPLKQRRSEEGHPNKDVEKLGRAIDKTDLLLLISPEYNHSIPGVLKNALDHYYQEYENKKIGYVTTSSGGFGGVRQLSHLHDFTLAVNADPGPHLPISNIKEKVDENGNSKEEDFDRKTDRFLRKIKSLQGE